MARIIQSEREGLAPVTPDLIRKFRAHSWRRARPLFRVASIAGACLFTVFVGWELASAPEILPKTVPLRIAMTGVMLLGLWSMKWPQIASRPQVLLYAGATCVAGSVSFLSGLLPHGDAFAVGSLTLVVLVLSAVVP